MAPRRGRGYGNEGGFDRYSDRRDDRSRDYIPRPDKHTNSSNRRPRDELTPPPRRRSRSPNRDRHFEERSANHDRHRRERSPDRSHRGRDNGQFGSQNAQHNRGRRGSSNSRPGSSASSRPGSSGFDSYRSAGRRGSDARQPDGPRGSHLNRRDDRHYQAGSDQHFARSRASDSDKPENTSEARLGNAARQNSPTAVSDHPPIEEVSIEERRKRREALKKKLGHTETPALPQRLEDMFMLDEPTPTKAPPLPTKAPADTDDMFASDDEIDLGAPAPALVAKLDDAASTLQTAEIEKGLADNWDDPKGYYRFSKNEILDKRYVLQDSHGLGKGMFSNVVRAKDKETGELVAVKIIRNNDAMRKAAVKEMDILEKLAERDPQDSKHMIRLHRSFMHKGHLCMVFENLSQDLRELLKKFGRDEGFNISAVRTYARQLFLGLSLLQDCRIIHADLKPDNILASEAPHSKIKICDLGSAFDVSEVGETPELASRFYRAPEVMLGIPYDYAIDMWSIGCTLFELYTGHILFTGDTNNQMLREIQECRGMFTERFVRQGTLANEHFEALPFMHFRSLEPDRLTGQLRARLIANISVVPERKMKAMLLKATPELAGKPDAKPTKAEKLELDKQTKEVSLLADLLEKCLQTNPEHRIKPLDALKHEFFGTTALKTQALSGFGVGPKFVPRNQSKFRVVEDTGMPAVGAWQATD